MMMTVRNPPEWETGIAVAVRNKLNGTETVTVRNQSEWDTDIVVAVRNKAEWDRAGRR